MTTMAMTNNDKRQLNLGLSKNAAKEAKFGEGRRTNKYHLSARPVKVAATVWQCAALATASPQAHIESKRQQLLGAASFEIAMVRAIATELWGSGGSNSCQRATMATKRKVTISRRRQQQVTLRKPRWAKAKGITLAPIESGGNSMAVCSVGSSITARAY